jgi:hypothetical protein
MLVADGTDGLKFSKTYSGQTKPQFYATYIEYTKNGNKDVKATTYLLYEKPKNVDINKNPADAKSTGGLFGGAGYYIVAGIVDNGKIKAVKNDGTVYLAADGKLKPYTPTEEEKGKYVLSNQERAEMVSTQVGSLNDLTRKNAPDVLVRAEPGLTRPEARGVVNNGVAPATTAPAKDGQGGNTKGLSNASVDTIGTNTPGTTAEDTEPTLNIKDLNIANQNESFFKDTVKFGLLSYPEGIGSNGQDFLKIEILEYAKNKLDLENLTITSPTRNTDGRKQSSKGTIHLGLQASITDQNAIDWTSDKMDAIQMGAAAVSLGFMKQGNVDSIVKNISNKIFGNQDATDALSTLAMTALTNVATNTGNSNLFTRVTGAVVNPNMELLFNGPQLRPFSFSFNLSPRGAKEAKQVKAIIKALKQSSAVQIGVGNLFLKTPFVYKLSYMTADDKGTPIQHPSMNRIKECALTNISIDYTPANVYMTYKDPERTMTSYTMQLQFTELDPIYGDDYKDEGNSLANVGSIGY